MVAYLEETTHKKTLTLTAKALKNKLQQKNMIKFEKSGCPL